MSGDATLGRMRLRRIRPGLVPMESDASMNVSSRTARVCARMSRVKPGITTIEMARMALLSPAPSMPTTARARTSGGKLGEAVHHPHEKRSMPPPRNPASSPMGTANSSAMPTIWNPERSDTRAP